MGNYKLNNTDLTLQPTTGAWVSRNSIGISGDGHAIYPALREYELRWDLISSTDLVQLQGFFNSMGVSGTVVATLPKYDSATGGFFSYSGCILRDLELGKYFETYFTDVKMLIAKIQV